MNKSITDHKESYTHLSIEEREELAIGLEKEESLSSIAERIGRHKSTISRELKRNNPIMRIVRYRANRAQQKSDRRQQMSHEKERLKNVNIREYTVKNIKNGWTPELIAGRLPLDKPGLSTNYESIYQWIYSERRDLIKELPRSHRKRTKRGTGKNKRSIRIPNRVSIDKRPDGVETREEPGHWEADTVVSRQSTAAVAVVLERKTRYCSFKKIESKMAKNMRKALVRSLRKYSPVLLKTITYDNGLENAEHEITNSVLGTQSFFCRPYHSWEKGSVENCIGLLRRYYPKKTDWALLSQYDLDIVAHRLNTRPKKCLGFRTPEEMFVALDP
jgi:IS30 family transposase